MLGNQRCFVFHVFVSDFFCSCVLVVSIVFLIVVSSSFPSSQQIKKSGAPKGPRSIVRGQILMFKTHRKSFERAL